MREILITVSDQKVTTNQVLTVVGTVGLVECSFEFDDHWDEFPTKRALFKNSNMSKQYGADIINNSCLVPNELFNVRGSISIAIEGRNTVPQIERSEKAVIIMQTKTLTSDVNSIEPTPDQYADFIARADERIDEYFTEHHDEFKGDKGDRGEGVESFENTGTVTTDKDVTKTYTFTTTDGDEFSFDVVSINSDYAETIISASENARDTTLNAKTDVFQAKSDTLGYKTSAETSATTATTKATEASSSASSASASASSASSSATSSSNSATLSEASRVASEEARDEAKGYAEDIEELTVSATTLPEGSDASVTKTGGGTTPYNLAFAIPKGDTGDTYTITEADYEEIADIVESQYTVELANLESEVDSLDLTKADKTKLTKTDRRLDALYELTQGQAWDFDRDDNNAYEVTVPSGAKLATVQKYGGKSLVFNQLAKALANNGFWTPYNAGNLMISSYADGVATAYIRRITETSSYQYMFYITEAERPTVTVGHVYYYHYMFKAEKSYNVTNGQSSSANITTEANEWNDISTIATAIDNRQNNRFYIGGQPVDEGKEVGDTYQVKDVMFIDLTQMFGAGNEPSTVEEIKALLPNNYYEYNTGEVIHADVDKVVYTDTDEVSTDHAIPQAIRNLEGYGWSAGSVYNEVNFERKKFIKRVGRVDMGTLNWQYVESTLHPSKFRAQLLLATITSPVSYNLLCNKYVAALSGTQWGTIEDKQVLLQRALTQSGIMDVVVKDTSYVLPSDFKTAMNGVYLYYELATPVETDITDILESFEVEAGGTITFHNSNGDGYRLPVPSTEEYTVKLSEVVSNG